MAGLFITTKHSSKISNEDVFSLMSFSTSAWKQEYNNSQIHCVISRLDRKDLWASAIDKDNKIYIGISGRIALNKDQWEKELNKTNRGGLAASYLIDEYLTKELQFTEVINGAFTILIIDNTKQKTFLITDRMGFYPVYFYENSEHITVATNFDAIANFESNLEYDLATMAEMLKFGYSVHPYTYYKLIKQLDPASIYEIKRNGLIKLNQYWVPQPKFDLSTNKKYLITELSNSIDNAVKIRTQNILGETGIFLSAGADSRVILAASEEPSKIKSFTFYDAINNELNLASQISKSYGSVHIKLQRNEEHYGLGAKKAARVISGLWNIQDAHYTNFLEIINSYNLDNFLSGCFADFFFKGIALNRRSIKLLGKPLPLYKTTIFNQEWYFGISHLKSKYEKLSTDRNLSQYDGIELTRDDEITKWMIEKARLFPISREATIGARMLLYRTLPWDPVLADNNLLEVYQQIPPSLKVNGEIWKGAVYNLTSKVKNIVDNNNLSTLKASKTQIIFNFLKAVLLRKLTGKDVDGTDLGGLITRGSWPNFYIYLKKSEMLNNLWRQNRNLTEEIFVEILGYNPYKYTTIDWADKDTTMFYRILTLKLWLEQN